VAIWKLDLLARSVRHLVLLADELRALGIDLVSVEDTIDTTTPSGRVVFHVLGAVAELERELIGERTTAGLAAAKRRNVRLGRRPVRFDLIGLPSFEPGGSRATAWPPPWGSRSARSTRPFDAFNNRPGGGTWRDLVSRVWRSPPDPSTIDRFLKRAFVASSRERIRSVLPHGPPWTLSGSARHSAVRSTPALTADSRVAAKSPMSA